ncbi:hypothetical protein ASZ90_018220 [hydrocarbon metagenome]|uniref:Uncharacterized protein n=1 Tax=hydrocarbon metagenome TaxID=938273 RepID=A0A0W8E6W1_9ZZZZ
MAKVLEKMPIYSNKAVENASTPIFPRYINDVYSIGTSLQCYIGDIYLHLAEVSQGDVRAQYKKMAIAELKIKEQTQHIANARLNEMLGYFYNNGGTIVEPIMTQTQAKAIQPFFNRMLDIFNKRVELGTVLAANGTISPSKIASMINYDITEMYSNMKKLFQVSEMEHAFNELIAIRTRLAN